TCLSPHDHHDDTHSLACPFTSSCCSPTWIRSRSPYLEFPDFWLEFECRRGGCSFRWNESKVRLLAPSSSHLKLVHPQISFLHSLERVCVALMASSSTIRPLDICAVSPSSAFNHPPSVAPPPTPTPLLVYPYTFAVFPELSINPNGTATCHTVDQCGSHSSFLPPSHSASHLARRPALTRFTAFRATHGRQ
ncbi:hypothetical protein FB45DRAFT_37842, partial [Roridomyces roridus]